VPRVRRRELLLGCVVVLLVTAWHAGSRSAPTQASGPPAARPAAGSVRLGPEPGEPVVDYLARLPALLPAPGVPVAALVQFSAELTPDQVAAVGPPPSTSVVLHVPLPRVQTALRFGDLDPTRPLPAALAAAVQDARFAAAADAARGAGRAAQVAAVEAGVLAEPACRCVLALVVRADRAGLERLMSRPGVRAVHAALAAVTPVELAVAPLFAQQTERADPLPDDGPVPAR